MVEAGVEGFQRRRTGGDVDVRQALLLGLGRFLAVGNGDISRGRVPSGIEEVESAMGDGRVAGLEESLADGVTDLMALSVDSLNVERDAGGESVKDSSGWDSFHMRANGGEGRSKGDFLEEDIR